MPEFPKNPQRLTPYPNYRFRVKWLGKYVVGVTRVSGLARSTQVIRHRDGADASTIRLAPGQTEYAPIMLERGVSYDYEFLQWANKSFDFANSNTAAGMTTSLGDFRRSFSIEVYNEAGQKVIAYNVYDAWVSEFAAGSELDGLGNAIVIENITVQHQGWDRQIFAEQPEPTFTLPAAS